MNIIQPKPKPKPKPKPNPKPKLHRPSSIPNARGSGLAGPDCRSDDYEDSAAPPAPGSGSQAQSPFRLLINDHPVNSHPLTLTHPHSHSPSSLHLHLHQTMQPSSAGLPSFIANAHQPQPSPLDRLANNPALPVFCYCAASILMTVVNKFVVSGHHFTMNFLLLTIQSVVCVGCVSLSKSLRLINYRDLDKSDAKRWFPISFLLVVVIYTGSKALQFLTIPVYTIFKNLTIILIAYGEVLWFSGTVTGLTLVSFGLMVLSSLIAAWSDISPALQAGALGDAASAAADAAYGEIVKKNVGYFWMLVNCLASAAYVLAMRKRIKMTNFKDWDTMFYNNLLSIPILVVFSIMFEDWSAQSLSLNFPETSRAFLLAAMAFSGAAAVFISYTTAWCVRTTSSTTYSMVGALNKLPVAASGMIFFGDPVSFGNVAAITTGFFAGLVYAVAKTNQQKNSRLGINSGGASVGGQGGGNQNGASQPLLFQKDIKA